MGDRVGSIAGGKQADLVIFASTLPGMVAAAQHGPVAAVNLHSSPGDTEYTITDCIVRKSVGKLVDVDVSGSARTLTDQHKILWGDLASEVIKRREALQKKIEQIDIEAATEEIIDQWHLDCSKLAEEL
jgi:hypothetical protein